MVDKTLLLQKLTQNAPKLAASLKDSLNFNTSFGKKFSEEGFKAASEALNRGYDMSLLNDIVDLTGPEPVFGDGFDFDLNMGRNVFPTDIIGKDSLMTPATQSAQSLKQFLPLTNPNIPASSMSKMFDVLKNVKPEAMSSLQEMDEDYPYPEGFSPIDEVGRIINTSLNNGYDPELIAQDMNSNSGLPLDYERSIMNANGVLPPFSSQVLYKALNAFPYDRAPTQFPAQVSAQTFLPNKPNKSWRRPPGDFSIDTFYEDNFGQTPRRRY